MAVAQSGRNTEFDVDLTDVGGDFLPHEDVFSPRQDSQPVFETIDLENDVPSSIDLSGEDDDNGAWVPGEDGADDLDTGMSISMTEGKGGIDMPDLLEKILASEVLEMEEEAALARAEEAEDAMGWGS